MSLISSLSRLDLNQTPVDTPLIDRLSDLSLDSPRPILEPQLIQTILALLTDTKNSLVRIDSPAQKLAVIADLIQEAKNNDQPILYIDSMQTLESSLEEIVIKEGSLFLEKGIAQKIFTDGGSIILDCDRFQGSVETCNSLLQERTYNGVPLSPKVKFIGLLGKTTLNQGHYSEAFLSRWDDKIDPPVDCTKAYDLEHSSPLVDYKYEPVEFHSNPIFKEILFGKIHRTTHWEQVDGPLLQRSKSGLILKNAPWHSIDFQLFIQELVLTRTCQYNGKTVVLPEDFKLFRFDGYTAKEMKTLETTVVKECNSPPIQISNYNFSTLFEQHRIKINGSLEYLRGLLFQDSDPKWVHITEPLTDEKWHRLFMEGDKKIKVSVDPLIDVPGCYQPFVEKITINHEISYQEIPTSDITLTSLNLKETIPTLLFIDITPSTQFEQLVYKITPEQKRQSNGAFDLYFSVEEGFLLEAIRKGTPICLRGLETNPNLKKELFSLLHQDPHLMVNGEKITRLSKLFSLSLTKAPTYELQDYLETLHITDEKWISFLKIAEKVGNTRFSYTQIKGFFEALQKGTALEKYAFLLQFKNNPKVYDQLKSLYKNQLEKEIPKIQNPEDRYEQLLDLHSALFFQGPSATGKSHLLKAFTSRFTCFGPITIGSLTTQEELWEASHIGDQSTLGVLYRWATDTTPGKKLLLLDELNLTLDGFWNILLGFFSDPPFMQIAGQIIPLTKDHKIVGTGNPDSYSGRVAHDILKKDFFTISFPEFNNSFLRKKILPEMSDEDAVRILTIKDALKELQAERIFGPRDLEEVSKRAFFLCHPDNPNALSQAIYSVYQGALPKLERKALQKILKIEQAFPVYDLQLLIDTQLTVTPSVQELASSILFALQVRNINKGKRGMIIEGPPGRGKDAVLEALLKTTKYYHITAENIRTLKESIKKAQEEGSVLVISELNLFDSEAVEGLMNDVLTGSAKTGFFVFITINPNLPMRKEFSQAFINRCIVEKIDDYTNEELTQILLDKQIDPARVKKLIEFHTLLSQACRKAPNCPKPTSRDLFKAAYNKSTYKYYLWRLNMTAAEIKLNPLEPEVLDTSFHESLLLKIIEGVKQNKLPPRSSLVHRRGKSGLEKAPANHPTERERYKIIGSSTKCLNPLITSRDCFDENFEPLPLPELQFKLPGKKVNSIFLTLDTSLMRGAFFILPVERETFPTNVRIQSIEYQTSMCSDGTFHVQLPDTVTTDARITYDLVQISEKPPSELSYTPSVTLIDELKAWWPELAQFFSTIQNSSTTTKIALLHTWIKKHSTYSLTSETRDALDERKPSQTWFQRFLEVRAGGCSEFSLFFSVLLNKMGVVTRIAAGPDVDKSKISNDWHSVVEYYTPESGWKTNQPPFGKPDEQTKVYNDQMEPNLDDAAPDLREELPIDSEIFIRTRFCDIPLKAYSRAEISQRCCDKSYYNTISSLQLRTSSQYGQINLGRAIKGNPQFFDQYGAGATKEQKKTIVIAEKVGSVLITTFLSLGFTVAALCNNRIFYPKSAEEFEAQQADLMHSFALSDMKQKAQSLGLNATTCKFIDVVEHLTLVTEKKLTETHFQALTGAIQEAEELDFSGRNIKDLTVLFDLKKLKKLTFRDNHYLKNFAALEKLSNLEELHLINTSCNLNILSHHTNLRKFSFMYIVLNEAGVVEINKLKQLVELNIRGTYIKTLPDFSGLQNLTVLNLGGNNLLKNISGIENLPNLENVDLSGARVQDLRALSQLTKLKILDISNSRSITDFTMLEALTNLEELNVSNTNFTDVSILSGLTKLRILNISGNPGLTQIQALENLPHLVELNVSNTNFADLRVLSGHTSLKILKLDENPELTEFSSLENLPQLEELYLKKTNFTTLSALSRLIKLKILDLGNNQGLTDLRVLENLPSLENLSLSGTNTMVLPDLSRTKLKILDLNYNRELTNISALKKLFYLEKLLLEMTNVTDLSPLAGLVHLRELHLSHIDELQDVSYLAGLERLEILHLNDKKIDISTLTPIVKPHVWKYDEDEE